MAGTLIDEADVFQEFLNLNVHLFHVDFAPSRQHPRVHAGPVEEDHVPELLKNIGETIHLERWCVIARFIQRDLKGFSFSGNDIGYILVTPVTLEIIRSRSDITISPMDTRNFNFIAYFYVISGYF